MNTANPFEIESKLATVRRVLKNHNLAGLRLRGTDWFAWATGGGSNVVLLTTDTGVAEVLITLDDAFIITDNIEAERLQLEELSSDYTLWQMPWYTPEKKEGFVREATHAGTVASDRPTGAEVKIPDELITSKRILLPQEVERYRSLGRDAAEAMTETLKEAKEGWTGYELAAFGASALWQRGIHPTLTLVGDERRLPIYRHATASADLLGERAMLVFCARRHGLFANLTRFIYFREPTAREQRMKHDLAAIEAEIFEASRPGATLGQIFESMKTTYAKFGYAEEIEKHHQGGPTGYLSREEVARPHSETRLAENMALAWNPSLIGTKIEDTVLVTSSGIEILTEDSNWPTFYAEDRMRPDYWVKT